MSREEGEDGRNKALALPQAPEALQEALGAVANQLKQASSVQERVLEGIAAMEGHLASLKSVALSNDAAMRGMEAQLAELAVAAGGARALLAAGAPRFVPRALHGPWAMQPPAWGAGEGPRALPPPDSSAPRAQWRGEAARGGGGGGAGCAWDQARGSPRAAEPLDADEASGGTPLPAAGTPAPPPGGVGGGEAQGAAAAAPSQLPSPPRPPRRVQPVFVSPPSPAAATAAPGPRPAASGPPSPTPAAAPAGESPRGGGQPEEQGARPDSGGAPMGEAAQGGERSDSSEAKAEEANEGGDEGGEEVVIAGPEDTAFHYVLEGDARPDCCRQGRALGPAPPPGQAAAADGRPARRARAQGGPACRWTRRLLPYPAARASIPCPPRPRPALFFAPKQRRPARRRAACGVLHQHTRGAAGG
jgi:hypothetical protein